MSYHKQGAVVKAAYDLKGDRIAHSDSPRFWWTFEREEPLDYIAMHKQGGDSEAARLYIFQGMQIDWA